MALRQRKRGADPLPSKLVYGVGEGEDFLKKSEVHVVPSGTTRISELAKSITNTLDGSPGSVERLAFEVDPNSRNVQSGVYKDRIRLIPDALLKRIAIQDSLVSNIVRARQNHMSSFGRPRPDRFSTGYQIRARPEILDKLDVAGRKKLAERISEAHKKFETCGSTQAMDDEDIVTFAQWITLTTRNAVVNGRIATEIIHTGEGEDRKFHHFAPTDAGTIYRASVDSADSAGAVRATAYEALCRLAGKKLVEEEFGRGKNKGAAFKQGFDKGEYVWIQVVEGRPIQAFMAHEMRCYNFYPVPDVEMEGYPVTPIDTVISAVTTHINIVNHNRLYFQSGRAARGMLVIKSDDAGPGVISNIKQQFNASINSTANAWRMPVFGCSTEEDIEWRAIDTGGGRDMEFQYLMDSNAREIMTAFMMSPEELPGWSYLSRGTNSQALSECVNPDSRITTLEYGLTSLGSVLGTRSEARARIWDGTAFVDARIFRSGQKALQETELECGVKLQTSPDHKYEVVGASGEPEWRLQADLRPGDYVLVNKNPVAGDPSAVPSFRGHLLTPEVTEVLGWITGDGSLVQERVRMGAKTHLFYHPSKEDAEWNRHAEILTSFGLKCHKKEKFLSDKEMEDLKKRGGFKSVSRRQISTVIYDTEFHRWLMSLGFAPSSRAPGSGKKISGILHVMPVEFRRAFLRGLFSADGGKLNLTGSVALTVQNDGLREQVRLLLLGLGIRTSSCRGVLRAGMGRPKTWSHKLFIKDRQSFWDLVGFSQDFKQSDGVVERWQNNSLPDSMKRRFLGACIGTPGFRGMKKSVRDTAIFALRGKRGASMQFVLRVMAASGVAVPQWLLNNHIEPVLETRDLGRSIEMLDVEMFSESHGFVAEGIRVHNSNNEYKLQAARDVGIRPLIASFEDYINSELFPLIDSELAKQCRLYLLGMEADNPEKESVRIQQDQALHMSFDDIREKVEKEPMGEEWGGSVPLNPAYLALISAHMTVGEIDEHFFKRVGASKDPTLAYRADPNWMQWQQVLMQQKMAQQQAQMAAAGGQQPGGGAPPQGGGGPPQDGGGGGYSSGGQNPAPQTENQKSDAADQASAQGQGASEQLARSIDEAIDVLKKSEDQLPPDKRRLLAQSEKTVEFFLKGFLRDQKDVIAEIMKTAIPHTRGK